MTRTDFKDIFDNHFDTVRNYIYYRSGDSELATDITQDTFLKIWEKKNESYTSHEIKGLLFKIANDLFISSYRKQKVASNFRLLYVNSTFNQSPEEKMEFQELKRNYELCLDTLPEKQRVVFLMSRIDKMKYHEITSVVGISNKAVEKRMSKALQFFKKELNY